MKLTGIMLLPMLGLAACSAVSSDPSTSDPTTGDPSTGESSAARKQRKVVFTTRDRYQGGTLGGLAGADAICASRASEAGLYGRFKAWLSDVDTSAASRLSHATGAYRLVDGTRIARNWDDLIDGTLDHAIDLDEDGARLTPTTDIFGAVAVWTNTLIDGHAVPWTPGGTPTTNPRLDCLRWGGFEAVGLVGAWNEAGTTWTSSSLGIGCTEKAHLYCLEQ